MASVVKGAAMRRLAGAVVRAPASIQRKTFSAMPNTGKISLTAAGKGAFAIAASTGAAVIATSDAQPTLCFFGIGSRDRLAHDRGMVELGEIVQKTDFNIKEANELQQKFNDIAKSGGKLGTGVSSDYITGLEFTNYFSQKLGLKHGQMSHLYDIFDKDNSGKIEFKEFAVLCSKLSKGTPLMKFGIFFRTADVDDSGALNKEELASMLDVLIHVCGNEQKGALSANELAGAILAEADANKDGSIDVKEFKAWVQKHSSTSVKLLYMLDVFAEIIVHG